MIKKEFTVLLITWGLVLSSSWLVGLNSKLFPYIFFIDVWFFSHPHAISTFFKHATLEKFSPMILLVMFTLIMSILSWSSFQYGSVVLFNIYFYWQWFHYSRQNYGVAIKNHNFKSQKMKNAEAIFLHLMPVLGLLNLGTKGDLNFLGYFVRLPHLNLESMLMQKIYIVAFLLWAIFQMTAFKRKEFCLSNFLNSFSAFSLYYWVYVSDGNFILAWLGMTFYHNFQYIIYNYADGKFRFPYLQQKNIIGFYGIVTLVSLFFYGLITVANFLVSSPFIPMSLVMIFSVNILHYVCDAVIWQKSAKLI